MYVEDDRCIMAGSCLRVSYFNWHTSSQEVATFSRGIYITHLICCNVIVTHPTLKQEGIT